MSTFETISQFTRMLKNLDQWLQTGTAYAQKKNFDPDVLAQARLAHGERNDSSAAWSSMTLSPRRRAVTTTPRGGRSDVVKKQPPKTGAKLRKE